VDSGRCRHDGGALRAHSWSNRLLLDFGLMVGCFFRNAGQRPFAVARMSRADTTRALGLAISGRLPLLVRPGGPILNRGMGGRSGLPSRQMPVVSDFTIWSSPLGGMPPIRGASNGQSLIGLVGCSHMGAPCSRPVAIEFTLTVAWCVTLSANG
jgi:hypothetical protein